MIKPIIFVPCQKVIEATDNSASLISVLEHISLDLPSNIEAPPPEAVLPFSWSVLILWQRTKSVGTKDVPVEAKVELWEPSPSKKVVMAVVHSFVINDQFFNFRNSVSFPIFPVGIKGTYRLTLKYRVSKSGKWKASGEYPIRLVINQPKEGVSGEIKNNGKVGGKGVRRVSGVPRPSKATRAKSKA